MKTLRKYKKNLHIDGDKVISYTTHVATIDHKNRKLYVHGYWSVTTSKHVNFVASEFGLVKEDAERGAVAIRKATGHLPPMSDDELGLSSIAMVAKMGDIFHPGDAKASNDWKERMLRAGLEGRGLIMPEDWGSLSEEEKTRRLDGAIKNLI